LPQSGRVEQIMKRHAEINISAALLQEKALRIIGVLNGIRRLQTKNHSDNQIPDYLMSIYRLLPILINIIFG
jgi:hypothetical protein